MATFEIYYTITGYAEAYVEAENEEEAKEKARNLDVYDDKLLEWSFDEVQDVKKETS